MASLASVVARSVRWAASRPRACRERRDSLSDWERRMRREEWLAIAIVVGPAFVAFAVITVLMLVG